MRIALFVILSFTTLALSAQEVETINWINANSIEIEDADPDSELVVFNDNIPEKFANAKIFGFGEASHHGKEFFDLKAKFFKYLVDTQEVKVFIMEEFYQAESGINEWIRGGKGDIETIASNFNMVPWYCKEVVNLLEWMRIYNQGKPVEEQIRFYGMDIQGAKGINLEVRDFVESKNIPVSEELLVVVDSCANKAIDYKKPSDWADIQIPKLVEVEKIILEFQATHGGGNTQEFAAIVRALNYIIKYTAYVQNPTSEVRDLKMFENLKWIVENDSKNGKAFIWAHNDHVNNLTFNYYGSPWVNLGRHLKETYADDYYSVGFDFGVGELLGYVFKKNQPTRSEIYTLSEPFRKTYAQTLIKATNDIYFVDMEQALARDPTNFFSTENRQLGLGGPGYNPKKHYIITKKYSEMFDGIIFVKNISVPDYKLKWE